MEISVNLHPEKIGVDFAGVRRHGAEYLYLLAPHEAKSNRRLKVGLEFGLDEKTGRIDLAFPPGWEVVAVQSAGRVIEHNQGSFKCHF